MPHLVAIVASLNGTRDRGSHERLPLTASALVADALAVRAAGAVAVCVQVRDPEGAPTLDPDTVDDAVHRIQRACPGLSVVVGVNAVAGHEPARATEQVSAGVRRTSRR